MITPAQVRLRALVLYDMRAEVDLTDYQHTAVIEPGVAINCDSDRAVCYIKDTVSAGEGSKLMCSIGKNVSSRMVCKAIKVGHHSLVDIYRSFSGYIKTGACSVVKISGSEYNESRTEEVPGFLGYDKITKLREDISKRINISGGDLCDISIDLTNDYYYPEDFQLNVTGKTFKLEYSNNWNGLCITALDGDVYVNLSGDEFTVYHGTTLNAQKFNISKSNKLHYKSNLKEVLKAGEYDFRP